MQYLQSNAGTDLELSEEDRILIQNLINENNVNINAPVGSNVEVGDGNVDDEVNVSNNDGRDYQQLLDLGEMIGGRLLTYSQLLTFYTL